MAFYRLWTIKKEEIPPRDERFSSTYDNAVATMS